MPTPRALAASLLASCCLAAAPLPAIAAEPRAEVPVRALDPESFLAEDAMGRAPRGLDWSPDGTRLVWVYPGEDGVEALWMRRFPDGEASALLRPTDLGAEGDELPRGLGWIWLPDGRGLVLSHGGDLHLLRFDSEPRLVRLTETEAEETDPRPSPDGSSVAFVRDHDLWLLELPAAGAASAPAGRGAAPAAERRLTIGGEEDVLLHGETDWVYWEELWGRSSEGHWWSPDGTRIAYYEFDETPVATYPLVDDLPHYPEVTWQKYPKAGTANPKVRFGVLDLGSGVTTWLETGWTEAGGETEPPYLARLHWRPDGARVAVQRINREQNRLDVLSCDPAGGACSVLLSERWPTWVNLENTFAFLADGGFVWGSERTGWRHLYRYDAGGALVRQLTSGDWAVASLDGVDEARGRAIATAFGEGELGAASRRVLSVPLDGGAPSELAGGGGWHNADAVAEATGFWIHQWSDADTPTRRTVRGPAGEVLAELPGEPPPFDLAALPGWKLLTIPGPEGSRLPAMLLEPAGAAADGAAGERHPVIQFHYGGPGSQVVGDRWNPIQGLWHKMMASRGYGVLVVDNLASAFFGKRGEDRLHRRFGPTNLAAQKAGVDYLATLPWADPERVGLWGWSGGGMHTLYCLLESPGTWRAGISGAPVTDLKLYDTIWTERYLDHPADNEEGYRLSSPVTHAEGLADALLIIHGTGDDNVHPQNTIVMSNALIEAGKPFEQAIYPKQKHGFRGAANRHLYRRMAEFFDRELGLVSR